MGVIVAVPLEWWRGGQIIRNAELQLKRGTSDDSFDGRKPVISSRIAAAITAAAMIIGACSGASRVSVAPAAESNLALGIASADSMIAAAIGKLTPGAVFLVAKDGRVIHERAFGFAQLKDYEGRQLATPRKMGVSTIFDLASLTKVMATTMAVMLLVDRGKIELDAPVYRYLPDFRGPHLDSITVRHLLSHSAGLIQWQPLYYHAANRAQTYAAIRDMPLEW